MPQMAAWVQQRRFSSDTLVDLYNKRKNKYNIIHGKIRDQTQLQNTTLMWGNSQNSSLLKGTSGTRKEATPRGGLQSSFQYATVRNCHEKENLFIMVLWKEKHITTYIKLLFIFRVIMWGLRMEIASSSMSNLQKHVNRIIYHK